MRLESVWLREAAPGLSTTRLEASDACCLEVNGDRAGFLRVRTPTRTVWVPLHNVTGMVEAEEKPAPPPEPPKAEATPKRGRKP